MPTGESPYDKLGAERRASELKARRSINPSQEGESRAKSVLEDLNREDGIADAADARVTAATMDDIGQALARVEGAQN